MLARVLVVATVAWPLLAGLAVWDRVTHGPDETGRLGLAEVVYLVSSQVCHQRPERSFSTQGVTWPVCARCSGLYLAAPFAGIFVLGRWHQRHARQPLRAWPVLAVAAVPTVLTLLWEWGGLGMPANLWRFSTALPLGAAITVVLIQEALDTRPANQSGTLTGHGSAP